MTLTNRPCMLRTLTAAVMFISGLWPPVLAAAEPWRKDGPAPGRWTVYPPQLISGQTTRIELRYVNGERALPPGAKFRFDLEPLSVAEFEHGPISTGFKAVAFEGEPPEVAVKASKPHGVGYTPVTLALPKGMKPGQSFSVLYGNRKPDGDVVGLVNPVPVHGLSFNVLADLDASGQELDFFEMGWWKSLPRVTIEAGPVAAMRVHAPSLVKAGSPCSVRAVVTDAFDFESFPPYDGEVAFEPVNGVSGLSGSIRYGAKDRSSIRMDDVRIAEPGVYRLVARIKGREGAFESNPIVVRDDVRQPIYWGLLHSHNWYSECWGDGPREHYRFARDVSGLDYCALSDHIGRLPDNRGFCGRLYPYRHGKRITGRDAWMDTMAAADECNVSGRFVALIGYEGGTQSCSHNNLYWADANTENYRRMFPTQMLDFPYENVRTLGGIDAIIIPHLHATYVPYSEWFVGRTRSGKPQMPVIEANSDWGMAFHGPKAKDAHIGGVDEKRASPLYEVVARGLRVGFVGDSDTHTGWPGRRIAGGISPGHNCPQGVTATRADELTRQGIIDAYRSRNTYATSGERIFLDVLANGVEMGQTLKTDEPVTLSVEVAGTDVLERVGLYNGKGLIEERAIGNGREVRVEFRLPAPTVAEMPYFVEVVQRNHHRAWSSAIWIGRATLPDLAWEKAADGGLCLINRGTADARDIRVMHDAKQTPFVRAAMPLDNSNRKSGWGQVWSRRWSDRKTTLFLCWKGPQINGTAKLTGYESYFVEPNRGQWWHGVTQDARDGTITFSNDRGRVPSVRRLTETEWRALDITVVASLDKPCALSLELDRESTIVIDGRVHAGRSLVVPINALTGEAPAEMLTIPSLKPGERWEAPAGDGIWSADPQDRILESGEDNNGFPAAMDLQ